ncbi:MAG: helix-turn-helix domain-containing protein [Cyclobacteriaceae bacterium]
MTVREFNTHQGLYSFEIANFNTALHSHPAIELIVAIEGRFSISTPNISYDNVNFAVIDANIPHKILASGCQLKLLMIEHQGFWIETTLAQYKISTRSGIYVENTAIDRSALFSCLEQIPRQISASNTYNERVNACLDFLESEDVQYSSMAKTLQAKVHLSESRLSHFFKESVGISLKKYLAWCRLKKTIEKVLQDRDSLFSASLTCGFYDQAHFSKTFKERLGISPSEVYNSRMLQD